MTVETRPGFIESAARDYSPLTPQQEENFQPRFIQSKKDIIRDLVNSDLIEFFYDSVSLHRDFWRGVAEHVQLVNDPIFDGEGIPKRVRGDGSTIVNVGGFLSPRWYYWGEARAFSKAGWDVAFPPTWVLLNTKAPTKMAPDLMKFAREKKKETGRKVKFVTHSLGGYDALAMFVLYPEEFVDTVDHLVLGASPLPLRINRALSSAYLVYNFFKNDPELQLADRLALLGQAVEAGDLKVTSIVSSSDPILQGLPLVSNECHYVIKEATHSAFASNKHFIRTSLYAFAGEEIDSREFPEILHPTDNNSPKAA